MKRLYLAIFLVLVVASVSFLGVVVATDAPIFHGFSGDMELIMCIDSELMWLAPESDVPEFVIPASRVFYNPASDFIYLMIDDQMLMTDFNHESLILMDFFFDDVLKTQAERSVLLVNDKNGSHVFCSGEYVFSKSYLVNIESISSDICLFSRDGADGAITLEISTRTLLGESDFGSDYRFINDKIVCLDNMNRFIHFLDSELKIEKTLQGDGEYYLSNEHIYKKSLEKLYVIDSENTDISRELPRFKNSFSNGDLLIGLSEENLLTTMKLPTLEVKTSNLEIPESDEWMWFRPYENMTLASIGTQGIVIDSSGETSFTDCKPVSSFDNLVLCSTDGNNCLFDSNTGNTTQINCADDCVSIISHRGDSLLLLVKSEFEKMLVSFDIESNQMSEPLSLGSDFYTVGTPQSNSLSDPTSVFDAGSIEKMKDEGFTHAATLFVDSKNPEKLMLFDSSSSFSAVYISPIPLK